MGNYAKSPILALISDMGLPAFQIKLDRNMIEYWYTCRLIDINDKW